MSEEATPYVREPIKTPAPGELTVQTDLAIAMIERVATNPNASMEALERILAMKERIDDRRLEEQRREQRQAYYTAMATCQSNLKVVTKNKTNKHTNSRYADLAALAESVDPVIHAHGFTLSFQPAGMSDKGEQLIKWTVAHSGGHIESDIAAIPVDSAGAKGTVNKTPMQAFGSTNSYGRRYLKLMLFDIATGDDNDGNQTKSIEFITEAQVDELIALADEVSLDKAAFCKYYEIDSFAGISTNKFNDAKRAIEKKRKPE
jgi:hypothetical protein